MLAYTYIYIYIYIHVYICICICARGPLVITRAPPCARGRNPWARGLEPMAADRRVIRRLVAACMIYMRSLLGWLETRPGQNTLQYLNIARITLKQKNIFKLC